MRRAQLFDMEQEAIPSVLIDLARRLRAGVTEALGELQQRAGQIGELPRTEEALRIALEMATIALHRPSLVAAAASPFELGSRIELSELGSGTVAGVEPHAAESPAPTKERFRLEASMWTIAYRGRCLRLRDSLGLGYLQQLLQSPGQRIHSIVLAAGLVGEGCTVGDGKDARRLIASLRREWEEARQFGHVHRERHLRARLEALGSGLPLALGRERESEAIRACAERARLNVSRAIAAALERIDANHRELGAHLRSTVRTGRFCTYTPDPRVPIRWET